MATRGVEDRGPGGWPGELDAMLGAITDYAIITLDPSGTVTRWSRGAEAMTGFLATEVLGQPVSILYADEDRKNGLVEQGLRGARDFGRFQLEGWQVKKGGERYWANMTLSPIRDDHNALTGFVAVAQDVTERKKVERLFQDLFETAPDATVIVGPDGRIARVNRQAEELFGYRRDELVGQEVEILVPQRFRQSHPALRGGFLAAPRARPMGIGLELYAMRRDGSEVPVEISLSPLETNEGVLVSAAIRDVTERHRQLEQLRRQRDEILELSTPVIQVWDKVLALPIIGTLDSDRASRLTESLLEKISEQQAEVVILDISGVPTIDTLVAQHLLKTVQAATLMGATSIMSGVRPETAQAMVHLGIDMGQLRSRNTLRDALQLALRVVRERSELADRATRSIEVEELR